MGGALACSCVLRWVPEIKEQERGVVVSEGTTSGVVVRNSTLRVTLDVQIFTELQIE